MQSIKFSDCIGGGDTIQITIKIKRAKWANRIDQMCQIRIIGYFIIEIIVRVLRKESITAQREDRIDTSYL
jgi:hypothetical protein